jgi:hypothetical protein
VFLVYATINHRENINTNVERQLSVAPESIFGKCTCCLLVEGIPHHTTLSGVPSGIFLM